MYVISSDLGDDQKLPTEGKQVLVSTARNINGDVKMRFAVGRMTYSDGRAVFIDQNDIVIYNATGWCDCIPKSFTLVI